MLYKNEILLLWGENFGQFQEMDRQTGGSFVWLFVKGHLARKQKYQEPQTLSSGWIKKSENGYLTGYQEDENSPNHVPNQEAFFLVGSWLRPEDFGFGTPLVKYDMQPQHRLAVG